MREFDNFSEFIKGCPTVKNFKILSYKKCEPYVHSESCDIIGSVKVYNTGSGKISDKQVIKHRKQHKTYFMGSPVAYSSSKQFVIEDLRAKVLKWQELNND